jgi:hypothetical protein
LIYLGDKAFRPESERLLQRSSSFEEFGLETVLLRALSGGKQFYGRLGRRVSFVFGRNAASLGATTHCDVCRWRYFDIPERFVTESKRKCK